MLIQSLNPYLDILREDLLPVSFGGNKYRIAEEYLTDAKRQGKTCVIGYGSIYSNLCRALSALCKRERIPCYLVVPLEESEDVNPFNGFLCGLSEATRIYCKKNEVKATVEKAMERCRRDGFDPYYINGDSTGHGNEATPVAAYEKVYREILSQKEYDYIFLPVGTGMTVSGLIAGKNLFGGKTKIVGVSVARPAEPMKTAVKGYLDGYFSEKPYSMDGVLLTEDYLAGGYAKYHAEIANTIDKIYAKYGVPLDPIYTGKGFWGMENFIKKNGLEKQTCLFIHTGGTPLFFDYLNERKHRK